MGGAVCTPTDAKVHGNAAFKAKDYEEAIVWYSRAIQEIHSNDNANGTNKGASNATSNDGSGGDTDILSTLYSNRAAAYAQLGAQDSALADAEEATRLRPRWPKAYYRSAVALEALGHTTDALDMISKSLALSPDDQTVIEVKQRILQKLYGGSASAAAGSGPGTGTGSDQGSGLGSGDHQTAAGAGMQRGRGCLLSWGQGEFGALGHGDSRDRPLPRTVDGFRGKHVTDLACGLAHSVIVDGRGDAFAFGMNTHGQCGLPPSEKEFSQYAAVPVLIPALVGANVVAVACGAGHTGALTADGRVFTWGLGQQGQLGHGVKEPVQEPRLVEELVASGVRVIALACGIAHTAFLDGAGDVWTCGLNNYGQLGLGQESSEDVTLPTALDRSLTVPPMDIVGGQVLHVSCGGAHTMLVARDGRIWASGSGNCGQLGMGDDKDRSRFHCLAGFKEPVAFTACGEEFTVVVSQRRLVYACGLGNVGQLGDGKTGLDKIQPHLTQITGLDNAGIEQVSCSKGSVLAIAQNGDVFAWGLPLDGLQAPELLSEGKNGDQDVEDGLLPRKVATLNAHRVRRLECGRKHYCAVTSATYAPFCRLSGIKKMYVAGEKQRFQIQAVDETGLNRVSGGDMFSASLVRVPSNYLKSNGSVPMGASAASGPEDGVNTSRLSEGLVLGLGIGRPTVVDIDDEMTGVYSGRCHATAAASYELHVRLGGVDIRASPFTLVVVAGPPHPPSCTAWWGRFSAASSTPNPPDVASSASASNRRPSTALTARSGQTMSCMVSLIDSFGNFCSFDADPGDADDDEGEEEDEEEGAGGVAGGGELEEKQSKEKAESKDDDDDDLYNFDHLLPTPEKENKVKSAVSAPVRPKKRRRPQRPVEVLARCNGTGSTQKCMTLPKTRVLVGDEKKIGGHVVPLALGPLQQAGAYAIHVEVGPAPPSNSPPATGLESPQPVQGRKPGMWDRDHIAGSPFLLTVDPGVPFSPLCSCHGDGLIKATVGEFATFRVDLFDKYQQSITDANDTATAASPDPFLTDLGNGLVGCREPLKGSIVSWVEYLPPEAEMEPGEAKDHSALILLEEGKPIASPNVSPPLEVTVGNQSGERKSLIPGMVHCSYKPIYSGAALLHVCLGREPVQGSPFPVRVEAGAPDLCRCVLTGEGCRGCEFKCTDAMWGGQKQPMWRVATLVAYDGFGNLITTPIAGGGVEACLRRRQNKTSASDDDLVVIVMESTEGTYDIRYAIGEPGDYLLDVTIGGQPIDMSPLSLSFPAPPKPAEPVEEKEPAETSTISQETELEKELRARMMEDKRKRELEMQDLKEQKRKTEEEESRSAMFEKLRREETTRRRAQQALQKAAREERRKKEEARRKASVKRTGGGFIIKYLNKEEE